MQVLHREHCLENHCQRQGAQHSLLWASMRFHMAGELRDWGLSWSMSTSLQGKWQGFAVKVAYEGRADAGIHAHHAHGQ